MGRCRETQPRVKLFFALMTRRAELFQECERELAEEFGPMDPRGEPYDFDQFTDYYAEEFGTGLRKCFVAVKELIAPEELVAVKRRANDIEQCFARRGRPEASNHPRLINIDPGYLSLSKVVLATTKDQAHRLYMGNGIFEEVTLTYRKSAGGFQPNPWTYPDYRTPERLQFFNRLREAYHRQLQAAE